MEFFGKLKTSFLSLNETSLKLIKYGILSAVVVCLIGLIISRTNIFDYLSEQFGIHIIMAGVSLFTQFIIGGLILDIAKKRQK